MTRTFAAVVAGLVAVVAALVTVPALWVSTHLADEDGYVELSSELATDSELQAAFAAYLSNELTQRGIIPAALEATATTALTSVAGRTSNLPGFVEAWEGTQRNLHQDAFAPGAPEVLAVDLGPMASFAAERASDNLPLTIAVPDGLVVPIVSDAQDRRAIDRIESTTPIARMGVVAVIVASLAAIVLARRRVAAIGWLGLGALAVAGVLKLVTTTGSAQLLDRVDAPSPFARTIQQLLVDRAADSLSGWLVWIAVAGGVAAVGGLAAQAFGSRRG